MNGAHLFFISVTVAIGVMLIAVVIYNLHRCIEKQDQGVDIDTHLAMESMRRMLERETGREVSVAYRNRGYWWAQTARGPIRVDELLRQGYVRVGMTDEVAK
jgi:predicted aspartyl protease